ncbi:MAG: undecaprenyl-phosphate glucose phosphotransferase [Bdellovibrionaceae bacterium]|nr:undecaprenyl-phosphate glucose phosphotransferase [Bdellovibrionales bacterium]MCB9255244.1 undecaprenyl-phosphate glucose phosphotransferase [Pseudobdellovibrionaceae bacterium]
MDNKQAYFLYGAAIKVSDALIVVATWFLCWLLRFDLKLAPLYHEEIPSFDLYSNAALPLALVFTATFHIVGAYRSDRLEFGFRSLRKTFQASMVSSLVFVSTVYFQGAILFSRVYLIIFAVLVTFNLFLGRFVLHLLWRQVKQRTRPTKTLIVGNGELLETYLINLERRRPYPIEWFGRLGPKQLVGRVGEIPYLGEESRLAQTLENYRPDQVILAYPEHSHHQYQSVLELLSNELVAVKVIPDFGKQSTFTYCADHEVGIPLLHFNREPAGLSDRFLKRMLDIVGASFFLILFSPLFAFISLVVKLTSRGPVFYTQKRVGADGKEFDCIKFRTMHVNAEAQTGPVWAAKDDQRTTAFGKWLRRTSLDELPQFWNILRGDMSLVGPRPERPNFVAQFKGEIPKYMLRHRMKSGITGWAQINGLRANTSLRKRIKFDLYYIGHWSHYFDLKIILLTPWILVRDYFRKNAY